MEITQIPIGSTDMLIRKPVTEVFEAIVNPDIITQFWFTQSSGRLEEGKCVHWTWGMFKDTSAEVYVKALEPNRRILMEWGEPGAQDVVEWVFTARSDDTTVVSVTNSGFQGTGDEVVAQALGSTQGFTIVLIGLKAFLEHGISLNLVRDKFPDNVIDTTPQEE